MLWMFQWFWNSKGNFTKTLNESSWSELSHYLTCNKFKLKILQELFAGSESNFELCRWIGNFFINILLSLNSVGVMLPTLISFERDGVGITWLCAVSDNGENVCKRKTRYLMGLKTAICLFIYIYIIPVVVIVLI